MSRPAYWILANSEADVAKRLVQALGISPVTAQVLVNRGICTPEDAAQFLHPSPEYLHNPLLLPGMNRAVARLRHALAEGEKVAIWGDYDVDGITASCLLYQVLSSMGYNCTIYIPNRAEEGYGVNEPGLQWLRHQGVSLVVTVDCGITSASEVRAASQAGLDMIITDHHEPGDVIPPAVSVIDPKLPGSAYPFRELSGVGVAYKLAQALTGRTLLHEVLDLVALGTVADVVPLLGENRVLVKMGLAEINRQKRPGLACLAQEAGIRGEIDSGKIAFGLGPRLNASGRLADAMESVRLLLSGSIEECRELARSLDSENRDRQEIERRIFEEVCEKIKDSPDSIIVQWGRDWHPGVIGIVASRLVERYHRPCVLVSLDEGKGSGRSIQGFNLYRALSRCAHLLDRFGGHEMAAGLSIAPENCEALGRQLLGVAREMLPPGLLVPRLRLDAEVHLLELSERLIEELRLLEPFGQGNPRPTLVARGLLAECRRVGQGGAHLKFNFLGPGYHDYHGILFRAGKTPEALRETPLDIAFYPEIDIWQDRKRINVVIRDVRQSWPVARGRHAPGGPGEIHQLVAERIDAGGKVVIVARTALLASRLKRRLNELGPSLLTAGETEDGNADLIITSVFMLPQIRHLLLERDVFWYGTEPVNGVGLRIREAPSYNETEIAFLDERGQTSPLSRAISLATHGNRVSLYTGPCRSLRRVTAGIPTGVKWQAYYEGVVLGDGDEGGVVLAGVPVSPEDFWEAASFVPVLRWVRCSWSRTDLDAQEQWLKKRFPDRDVLVSFYLSLKKLAGSDKIEYDKVVQSMSSHGDTGRVARYLAILQEAGVLSISDGEIRLLSRGTLAASRIFAECEVDRAIHLEWLKQMTGELPVVKNALISEWADSPEA